MQHSRVAEHLDVIPAYLAAWATTHSAGAVKKYEYRVMFTRAPVLGPYRVLARMQRISRPQRTQKACDYSSQPFFSNGGWQRERRDKPA